MISSILTEIPPVSREECFAVFERHKTSFNFPIHVHSLFELNYIENAAGAQRIVGDHTSEIDDSSRAPRSNTHGSTTTAAPTTYTR